MGAQVALPLSLFLSNTHTHTHANVNTHLYRACTHTHAEIQIYNTLFLIEPFETELRAEGFCMITSQKHLPDWCNSHQPLLLLQSVTCVELFIISWKTSRCFAGRVDNEITLTGHLWLRRPRWPWITGAWGYRWTGFTWWTDTHVLLPEVRK